MLQEYYQTLLNRIPFRWREYLHRLVFILYRKPFCFHNIPERKNLYFEVSPFPYGFKGVLAKPYRFDSLGKVLNEIIETREESEKLETAEYDAEPRFNAPRRIPTIK